MFFLSAPSPIQKREGERRQRNSKSRSQSYGKLMFNRNLTNILNIHFLVVVLMCYLDSIMDMRECRSLSTLDGFNCAIDFLITCRRSYIMHHTQENEKVGNLTFKDIHIVQQKSEIKKHF